jgi:hypothetical protein
MVGSTEWFDRRRKHRRQLFHYDIHLGGKQVNAARNTIAEILVGLNPVLRVRKVLVVLSAGNGALG